MVLKNWEIISKYTVYKLIILYLDSKINPFHVEKPYRFHHIMWQNLSAYSFDAIVFLQWTIIKNCTKNTAQFCAVSSGFWSVFLAVEAAEDGGQLGVDHVKIRHRIHDLVVGGVLAGS